MSDYDSRNVRALPKHSVDTSSEPEPVVGSDPVAGHIGELFGFDLGIALHVWNQRDNLIHTLLISYPPSVPGSRCSPAMVPPVATTSILGSGAATWARKSPAVANMTMATHAPVYA